MKKQTLKRMANKAIAVGVLSTMSFFASPDTAVAHSTSKLTTSTIKKDVMTGADIEEFLTYSEEIRDYINFRLANPSPDIQLLIDQSKERNLTIDELIELMHENAMDFYIFQKRVTRQFEEQIQELYQEEYQELSND